MKNDMKSSHEDIMHSNSGNLEVSKNQGDDVNLQSKLKRKISKPTFLKDNVP